MEDFRSKSYRNGRSMQSDSSYYADNYNGNGNGFDPNYRANSNPSGMQDLRCYSASYASSSSAHNNGQIVVGGGGGEEWKFKKGKSTNAAVSKSWSFGDPELQRKKRVASYKAYTVEGKVKGSIKKSFRWLKERYTLMLHGYRWIAVFVLNVSPPIEGKVGVVPPSLYDGRRGKCLLKPSRSGVVNSGLWIQMWQLKIPPKLGFPSCQLCDL